MKDCGRDGAELHHDEMAMAYGQTYTPQHLLAVPPADGGPHLQGEALIRKLLEYPAPCAIRIGRFL